MKGYYASAELGGTTLAVRQTGRIGVRFDVGDGSVVRLALSRESARHLAEVILEYEAEFSRDIDRSWTRRAGTHGRCNRRARDAFDER